MKILRKNSKTYNMILLAIQMHNKYSRSFHWRPPAHASSRRREEFDSSFGFQIGSTVYSVEQSLQCSCNHYYYSMRIEVDGVKKDIRSLKKLHKSFQKEVV